MTLAFHGKSKARQRWLIVIAVAMVALAAFAGGALRSSESARAAGTVMYSSIPAALPGNVVSQAFQATQASEFGDRVTFVAGSGSALGSVTVVLSSWGCQAGTWLSGDCSTTPGATFSHPITLNLYQDGGSTPGALIAAQTQTFAIPYRPSADTINCTGPNAGKWYSVADARCYNGLATKVTFHFPNPGLTVPATLVWGVAFNTTNWGYSPIGPSACSATVAGCGYDSLNIGTESLALVGTDVDPNGAFYNSVTAANYCDGGTGGTGAFRLDDGCWTGYRPMAEFNAPVCTPTGFFRDGVNMTAALINPPGVVSGEVDATGCNIGVYYDSGTGTVNGADIHGANYFGVLVNGDLNSVNVDVTGSQIHQIGEVPFNGAQHGVAVYYRALGTGTATGNVSGNTIRDYQKGGITGNGAGATVDVTDNVVTGLTSVLYIAQNGIQLGYGAHGTVKRNTVDGNWYDGASWSSTGILIFQASGIVVTSNTLSGNQIGIGIESWCYLGGPAGADRNQVSNNTVSGSAYGITVAAYDYFSGCDPHANDNKIVNNVLVGAVPGGEEGIFVGTWDPDGGYTPQAQGTKLVKNRITDFTKPIELSGDAGTKQHANVVTP